ncbi:MAG TPA: type II toxin-antitoxin system RatA family toxin [Burkholderiaceae bacterium]|nr:type II toxin-antitoxin system RatA family toxin [Burkholderiaceae bacterium]
MKRVHKSILLWYSPREMYDLVVDFEHYPRFLPWCERVDVLQRDGDSVTARLHMAFAGVRHAITTRNTNVPVRSVLLRLVDGPFSQFDGLWQFEPIGSAGSEQACRIEFELDYAFASRPLETVLSPVFDKVADTLVDRFVQRAQAVYGER